MLRRSAAALAIVIAVAGCRMSITDLPQPPSLTAPPPWPGQGDIAFGHFASPLSALDAERILLKTEVFAVGQAGTTHMAALHLLLNRPNAHAVFDYIATRGKAAGKLYAVCAFEALNEPVPSFLLRGLDDSNAELVFLDSDMVWYPTVPEMARQIQTGRLSSLCRNARTRSGN